MAGLAPGGAADPQPKPPEQRASEQRPPEQRQEPRPEQSMKARSKANAASYQPVTFAELPGWAKDDHLAAFKAFLMSCERVVASARERAGTDKTPPPAALVAACSEAQRVGSEIKSKDGARAFFERAFTPNAVVHKGPQGLLTGYYEPLLQGSRKPEGPYQT